MKMINKIGSILEERRLWKEYIVTNRAAEYLGKLTGTRPYFMSFDEYKEHLEPLDKCGEQYILN